MKNFKKLSREELKNTHGGQACSVAIQQPNGKWVTYSGTCNTKITVIGWEAGGELMPAVSSESFCNIGNGVSYPLSSNGGVSRCS